MPQATDDEVYQELSKFRVAKEAIDALQIRRSILQNEKNAINAKIAEIDSQVSNFRASVLAAKGAINSLLNQT